MFSRTINASSIKPGDKVRFTIDTDKRAISTLEKRKALSPLRDDAGKVYQPNRIENKGSGHHRQLVLVFPQATQGSKRLELLIKDIAGVKERSFVWDLQ